MVMYLEDKVFVSHHKCCQPILLLLTFMNNSDLFVCNSLHTVMLMP